jgi:hypothetical protein
MASHLSTLGILTQTNEEFHQFIVQAAETGTRIEVNNGAYIQWTSGVGAEIWLQVNQDDEVIGIKPHFSGNAIMPVALTERIEHSEYRLNGAFYAWADPQEDSLEFGEYPFVFDTPDYLLYHSLILPKRVNVQLAAFAYELQAFENEAEYYAAQQGEIKFFSESFIPTGTFSLEGVQPNSPQAEAMFTGYVLQTTRLTNPTTGGTFYWAHVRTLGGEIDVVVDPEVLNGKLTQGGIIQGAFWLSGRVMKEI